MRSLTDVCARGWRPLAVAAWLLPLTLTACETKPRRTSRPDTAPATQAAQVQVPRPSYLARVGVICTFDGDATSPRLVLDAYEGLGKPIGRFLIEDPVQRKVHTGDGVQVSLENNWPAGDFQTTLENEKIRLIITGPAPTPTPQRSWVGKARMTFSDPMRPVSCAIVGE